MTKQTKIFIARLWNHPERGGIREAFIQAELARELQPPRVKKSEQGKGDAES